MNKLFFWNEWKKNYKLLYLLLFSIFLGSLLIYTITYIAGNRFLIHWDAISQFDTIRFTVDQFRDRLLDYSVDTTAYITKERFFGTDIRVIPMLGTVYLLFLAIGICVALTIITRLELAWFAIGMGLFIFLIVLLHTELLGIWGGSRKFAIVTVLVFGALGFYFQAYDEKFSFMQRLLAFMLLTAIFATVAGLASKVAHPFFYMSNFGIIIPLILSVIFIISIAFDIVIGFLYISVGKSSKKNSIFHFTFICLLYFINLLLIFLKKKGIVTGDFISLSVFVIYMASAVLGIWGVKRRAILFQNILPLSLAAFLYISFAIIATATIAYAFVTGNDPLIYMFEYAILYSHMGIGIVFFLYILYNFWELFDKNVSAYDLMFKPRRMPFFMVRPLGIVVMLSLFLQSNMVPLKHAKAGYYNLQGDVFLSEGKLKEAKDMYYEGSIFSNGNVKSNYSLASVLIRMNESKQAEEFLANINERRGTEFSYANLGNLYLNNDKFFYSWFTLKDGLKKFPESGYLHNNMAMLYSTKGLWDSTFYHLNKANQYLKNNEAVNTNLMWLFLRVNLQKEADSILSKHSYPDYISFCTNKLVAESHREKKHVSLKDNRFLKDSILNLRTYAFLYNSILGDLKTEDTSLLSQINHYTRYQSNEQFYFELLFLKSLKYYYSGNRKAGIDELSNLASISGESSAFYYNKILGLWAIDNDNYAESARYFHTTNLVDPEAQLYKGLALLEMNITPQGLEIIQNLTKTPNDQVRARAAAIAAVYSFRNTGEVLSQDDSTKLNYLHFKKMVLNEPEVLQVYQSFTNEEYRMLAGTEVIDYYRERGQADKARGIYNSLAGKAGSLKNEYVKQLMVLKNLELLQEEGEWPSLINACKSAVVPENKKRLLPYFSGVAYFRTGNFKEARKYFKDALRMNPLTEEVYVHASTMYQSQHRNQEAYDIIVEGMRLNPSSTDLLKEYAFVALKLNLTNYADETVAKIRESVSPAEFSGFKQEYDKARALAESQFNQY